MKLILKYFSWLLLTEAVVLIAGYLILSNIQSGLKFRDLEIMSLLFSFTTFLALMVFSRGQSKEPGSQTLHSFVAVSLKFLTELLLALYWFLIAKKTGFSSALLFFVIYLTFTLFFILIVVKTLKDKTI